MVIRGPHVERKQKYCSQKCGNTASGPRRTGVLNGHWKGGVSPTPEGYLMVTHGKDANRLLHRVVMERHLGRSLTAKEIVHHINHDKTDNRIKNLQIVTRSQHATIHLEDAWRQIRRTKKKHQETT